MITFFNLNELEVISKTEPIEVIKDGILPQHSLLLISGQPKTRKSFLANNFALAIAHGKSFAGFEISQPQKVLVISGEGGVHSNSIRLTKMRQSMELNAEETNSLNENIKVSFIPRIWLNIEQERSELIDAIKLHKPSVLILDPFIRFHNVNENDASEMSTIFGYLRQIIADYKLSIILIHHHGKTDQNGARGSSTIEGEYDSSIKIGRAKSKNYHELTFDLRHSESPDKRMLYFDPETFWFLDKMDIEEDAILSRLKKEGSLSKKSLVEKAVDQKLGKRSTIYGKIKKFIEEGTIILNGEIISVK